MTLLIYGAYGYTGALIAEEAAERNLDIIVAGRNEKRTEKLGDQLDCATRLFDAESAFAHLDGVNAVLNCAGPFVETYEPFVEACLDTGTHYLDITGELSVFEAIAERDRKAEKAGICLLPGVGFDVVPTDCLAGHLHDRLPSANELTLGFDPTGTVSKGTVSSMLEHAGGGGKVRRKGDIVDVPPAHKSRRIDFGRGERNAATIPWGDVSTAYYTTGIENIEVYTAMPEQTANALRLSQPLMRMLQFGPIKRTAQALAKATVHGPSEYQRQSGACHIWGEATDGETTVTSRLKTPETYAFTVEAATTAASRVLEENPIGFQTPAAAFTPEFVLDLDGVEGFFDE